MPWGVGGADVAVPGRFSRFGRRFLGLVPLRKAIFLRFGGLRVQSVNIRKSGEAHAEQ